MIVPFYSSDDRDFTLLNGDCRELLPQFQFKFDMIFADPPYFLSNGGITIQSGKVVCVDKGEWDKCDGAEMNSFNREWIALCREKLKEDGTIWISGTYPLAGSSTTGIAANLLGRRYLGIEKEKIFTELSKARKLEITNIHTLYNYQKKIKDIQMLNDHQKNIINESIYISELPF